MHTPTLLRTIGLMLAFLPTLLAGRAHAQLTLIEQHRGVSTFLLTSPCGEPAIQESNSTTLDGLFRARSHHEQGCEQGSGSVATAHRSFLGPESLRGEGAARSAATGMSGFGLYAFGFSTYESTFEVTEPTDISIQGLVTAQSTEQFSSAAAAVVLFAADRTRIFEAAAESNRDRVRRTERFDRRLTLEPGRYTLNASASSLLIGTLPPDQIGDGLFRFTLDVVDN